MVEQIEPIISVLTAQDIKDKFVEDDYFRLLKNCNLISINDYKQRYSVWLKDNSGDFHILMLDKSNKHCTYLGSYEGAKFDVVLAKDFFDKVKSFFSKVSNENNNSINKFSAASNSSILIPQKT